MDLKSQLSEYSQLQNQCVDKEATIEELSKELQKLKGELSLANSSNCSVMYPQVPPLGEVGMYMTEPPVMYPQVSPPVKKNYKIKNV